nr:immunoglobulin heavy chain junction region [Mus musculus]
CARGGLYDGYSFAYW